tara:strand:- start:478 stop:2502 length:2025 start_codon:yes stop_codon:yes gene_type:complete
MYNVERNINTGELFKITTPDGTVHHIRVGGIGTLDNSGKTNTFTLNPNTHNFGYTLNWHNCYSFGNGVESNRIRDNFNKPFLTPGVRVSTIFEDYKEEERSNSLIFSGIYNSIGSVNNLNQFIQAEQITKELNPTYGSVQKLFTRDSDLVVLCEDKVLKVLGNKDAVFNADGNPQLTANQNVLGQSMPFVGEYGISKNPESFVSEAYRSYFTDKQRGTVMRLSKDGLTPISLHGMKDYFRDNLKNENILLGSYDKKKDEYNVTLPTKELGRSGNLLAGSLSWVLSGGDGTQWAINNGVFQAGQSGDWGYAKADVPEIIEGNVYELKYTITVGGTGQFILANHGVHSGVANSDNINLEETLGDHSVIWTQGSSNVGKISLWNDSTFDGTVENISVTDITNLIIGTTATFNENVKGWTSFKSFVPEGSVGCSGDYYTFNKGKIYKHHDDAQERNNFYGVPYSSKVNVLLNDAPSNIKTYNTVDYEGTEGWAVTSVKTDQSEGAVNSFVEKEGKYYNYIQGIHSDINNNTDFASADIQGGGILLETPDIDEDDGNGGVVALTDLTLKLNSINTSMQVGDTLYYVKAADLTSTTADNVVKYGQIDSINRDLNEIKVTQINYQAGVNEFEQNDFLMFAKDKRANKSSVSGYYADLNFENNSVEKAELFTVASEIQESSK